jgi:hypothetical protein
MPSANSTWTVLPHGPLEQVAENLWCVEGSLPDMPLKRLMVIARTSSGGLVIHNAIALDEPAMRAVEALGAPSFLIVPNGWHRLDAKVYKERYPALQVFCPKGARARVSQVVEVSGSYADFPPDPDIRLEHIEGVGRAEGVLSVRSSDGVSLAFGDLVFNQPHLPGLFGFIYRLMGSSGGPKVTFIFKMLAVKDRAAVREHLLRLAGTPDLRRVMVMHGERMTDPALLRQVASTLA